MPRRIFIATGALLAGAGLLAGIVSLAVPWGRYRVSGTVVGGAPIPESVPLLVFQLPGGTWYLLALAVLAGLLTIAALDTGRAADLTRTVAPTLGIVTVVVVIVLANTLASKAGSVEAIGFAHFKVSGETAYGVWIGLAAGPLLGFGTGAVALRRRRGHRENTPPAADPSAPAQG